MDRRFTLSTDVPTILLMLLLFCLVAPGLIPARAQSDEPPTIALIDGDLYLLQRDGTRQQLTTRPDDRKQAYALRSADVFPSPDGRYVVYRDVPEFVADALLNNEIASAAELPTDLFLIDVASGEEIRFAAHAPDTVYRGGRLVYRAGFGHAASWSPAGDLFVYIERVRVPNNPERQQLLTYNAVSHEDNLLAQVVAPDTLPQILTWTALGIVNGSTVYDDDGKPVETPFMHGDVVAEYPFLLDGSTYVTVQREGHPAPEGSVYMFDLSTGEYFSADGYASIVSMNAPNTSLVLLDYLSSTSPEGIYAQNGERVYRPRHSSPFPVDFSLSPDGTQVSFVEIGSGSRGSVIVDAQGEETPVAGVQILGWGTPQLTLFNPGLQVELTPTTALESALECGTATPDELLPGDRGIVLGPDPNRLRAAPSLDAEQVGVIPGGEVFDVVEGQQNVCAGGSRWFQVTYDFRTGWTAATSGERTLVQSLTQRNNR
ncbi:MAG: SH3 domain-containing protein [Anaerolineae bacterium]|nr:SH3 domain-containing protein [Anaerolineae bacterium]